MAARMSSWSSVVGVLIGLELRQRLRTTRWRVTLAVTFTVMSLAVFGSMYLALSVDEADANYDGWARNLYAVVLGVELFLGVVLAPTLTATSINGDRKDATLSVVQATPISHWQLAVGKLLGSWVSCLALVAVASPYLVWGIVAAPYGIGTSVLGVIVLCVIFLCYCGIGLGYSALTARPAGSAVLTQATVFFLVLGLPALFGLLYSTTAEDHEVVGAEYTYVDDSFDTVPDCRDVATVRSYEHTERIWWLLAPNPFLILPDVVAADDNPSVRVWTSDERPPDPSVARPIAETLSTARTGPYLTEPTCADTASTYRVSASNRSFYDEQVAFESGKIGDSWYLGLAVNVILGALGLTVAARRLRVPARTLPRGVRIT
ncbi:ABC transporter permease [Rhodococcus sp. SORGH_AS_0301]|uniref:ABC transporter permease n=1 Tax=Rhodococcus sp. SORGH_AS_0301 TaxID=3041780 RepID=UPI00278764B3|nr:ABC transporter permease subunit [Rhodococcus sp. SORGH_AS_0301]MDQ1181888.1 ABC-type transport system involved in multi-copper enzyme maturation permease subunit [Rhodococcus sp. SORGH_AS_0301]